MRLKVCPVALATLVTCAAATAQELKDFKVVVNGANPVSSLTKEQVAKLFFKQVTAWNDGVKVLPVDQGETSQVRQVFSVVIHARSVGAVKAFWQRQIFSGRDVPPPEAPTDADVLTFVDTNRGAIGYVSASAPVRTAKVVKVVP